MIVTVAHFTSFIAVISHAALPYLATTDGQPSILCLGISFVEGRA